MPFASEIGKWDPRFDSETSPGHAHLLPNGKVLYWFLYATGPNRPRVWNPSTGVIEQVEEVPLPRGHNIFCSGHSFLPNGHLLIAGGGGDKAHAEVKATTYNPFASPGTSVLHPKN
jgi:hypothetical protein